MKRKYHYIAMIDAYPLQELEMDLQEKLAKTLWSMDFTFEGKDDIKTHMEAICQQLNATAIERLESLFTENKAHVGLVGFTLKNEDGTLTNLMEQAIEHVEIIKNRITAIKKGEEQVQLYIDNNEGYESFYKDEHVKYDEIDEGNIYGTYEVYWYSVKK